MRLRLARKRRPVIFNILCTFCENCIKMILINIKYYTLFQPPLLMRRRLQLRRPLMTRLRTGERLLMVVMGGTKVI